MTGNPDSPTVSSSDDCDVLYTPGTWGLSAMVPAYGLQSSQLASSEQEGGGGSSRLHNSVPLIYSKKNIITCSKNSACFH